MKKYASIIIDITNEAVDRPFYYFIPLNLNNQISIGTKVLVPFGNSNNLKEGFVISILNEDEVLFDKEKIKEINNIAKNKISINDILLKMAIYMSKEYLCPLNLCLKTVLQVKRTIRKNIRQIDISKYYEENTDTSLNKKHILNEEQNKCKNDILLDINKEKFSYNLLYGITGSGKTEVYMSIINEVIKMNKKVIILIPEISLTYQTVIRLSKRFIGKVAIIHSKMSEGEKFIQYEKCINNEIDILVGPRSAIFAPFENLGLIIIDEEHDRSYISETSPRYNTIDLAEFRAKSQNATLLLGSATPSLKTYTRALNGEISIHKLTKRASNQSQLAKTYVVDLRDEFKNKNKSPFSKILNNLILEKLEKKEQIILFMNRRGYSNLINCRSCGHTIKCPHCSVALTVHKNSLLKCHYCGYEIKEPLFCPECKSPHIGTFGMGTEKLETYVKKNYPKARVLRMDADTTQKKGSLDKIIEKFRNKEADILIGTQMIVKGHDFPNVSLVGIMAADMSLYIPDYKSSELTFQLITQCSGRSGRSIEGDVVIQTYDPDHYAIEYASNQDYEKFYQCEIEFRKMLNYPPFIYLLSIEISCLDESYLNIFIKNIKAYLIKNIKDVDIFGPSNANIYKIKDVYRKMIYIKGKNKEELKIIRNDLNSYIKSKNDKSYIKCNFNIE
ncbi:MAG: primosomal protein N' [Eubacteriales bacterium]|nr:primosomal protein N' [Eubacteriales bacterium]